MSREWQLAVSEFTSASADGMRRCLALAEDIKEYEGGGDEERDCLERIREQLRAMVKMEREVGHVQSAMQHVETVAAGVQAGEEPPALLEEMDNKMTSLMEETFDPSTHPSMQEFAQILSSRVEGGESGGDEDIQVEKVQVSLKCPLTGRYLEDPVTNAECGHTYSRAAVMSHIRQRAARAAKCPVCSGPLSVSGLRAEPGLADKARRAQRRGSRQPQASAVTL